MSDEKSSKKGGVQQVLRDLVIGGSMGALSKTVMSPVERVKLLMQMTNSHPDVVSGKVKGFDSMGECAQRIYKTQGVLAFWRGNLVNCLRYAPQQGSALAFNDAINDLFPKYDSKKQFWPSLGSKLMSGGLAGAIANTICYPFDFARTRLASDVGTTKQFNGIMDCIATTVRQQGIRGLYTGWSVTVAGAFVYRAGQLGCFRQIQDMNPYKNDKGTLGAVSSFAAVTAARTVVLPFNYPFDTVRRRMMQWADKPLSERIYKSSVHCFTTVLKTEGLRGIYAGALPEIFRGIGGSLVIVAYDRIKVIYNL